MYLYVTVSCGVLVMINFGSVNVVRCNFEKSISLTDGGKSIRTVRTSRTTTVWDTYYNYYPTDKPWITGHIKQLIKELATSNCGANTDGGSRYRLKPGKVISIPKKSITCEKTMSVSGGTLLTQCQVERKVNLSLQLSVTDSYYRKVNLQSL